MFKPEAYVDSVLDLLDDEQTLVAENIIKNPLDMQERYMSLVPDGLLDFIVKQWRPGMTSDQADKIFRKYSSFNQGGSVGFNRGGLADILKKAYYELKEELGRAPSQAELMRKTGISQKGLKSNIGNLKLSNVKKEIALKSSQLAKEKAMAKKVTIPTHYSYDYGKKKGVKWPSQEIKKLWTTDLEKRYQFPKQSFEYLESRKANKVLDDIALAEKYGVKKTEVERINKVLKEEKGLQFPKKEVSQANLDRIKRRKDAIEIFSDPAYEGAISGTTKVNKSHMGDLYNRPVTTSNIGYAPAKVNLFLEKKIDPAIKSIYEKQDKLIKNKPKGWKQSLENLNVKGMKYAALSEGYKNFETTDPNTLKKSTYGIDYGKTIDPLGTLEGKKLKDLSSQDKQIIELNRKAVFESQSKTVPESQIKKIAQNLNKAGFKCKFDKGGLAVCDNPADYADDIARQAKLAADKNPAAINKFKNARNIVRKGVSGLSKTGVAAIGELLFAFPFAVMDYTDGLSFQRIIGNATLGLFGQTEDSEIRSYSGGYQALKAKDFAQTATDLQDIMNKEAEVSAGNIMLSPDDINLLPSQVEGAEKRFLKASDYYSGSDGYERFLKDLDNEQKIREEIQKKNLQGSLERKKNVQKSLGGVEPISAFAAASGGLANLTTTIPPKRGPNSQGLASLKKYGKQY
jgi:hypothetical protein